MRAEVILRNLGDRVQHLRKKAGLSQPEMARRAGMSLRSYQSFEATGNVALRKLANILIVLELEKELASLLSAPKPSFDSLDEFEKTSPARLRELP